MNSVIKVATECYRQVKYGKGFGLPTYFLFWVSAGVSKQAPGCTAAVARAPCAAQGVTRGCQGAFMAFIEWDSVCPYAILHFSNFHRMDEDGQGIEAKGGELRQSCAEAEREGREDFEAKRRAPRDNMKFNELT